jgi:hypothetical protein
LLPSALALFGRVARETGTFAELSMQPPNALTFRFFGGVVWRVVLLAEREFSIPVLSDPSGVSRKFKFFRHFRIEGKPQPERAWGAAKRIRHS